MIRITKEVASITKNFPTEKSWRTNGFTGELYLTFKELTPILVKLFKKNVRAGHAFKLTLWGLIPRSDQDTTRKENYRLDPWWT